MEDTDHPPQSLLVTKEILNGMPAKQGVGVAIQREMKTSNEMRKPFAWCILVLFCLLNLSTVFFVAVLSYQENALFREALVHMDSSTNAPDRFKNAIELIQALESNRTITSKVLISLISATAVQAGIIMLSIVKYLFQIKKVVYRISE